MATKQQRENFIKEIGPIALAECKKRGYNNALVWTCISQACDESAYGLSQRMRNSNAYFGIKANKYWIEQAKYGGLVYSSRTKECYDGKNYTTITDAFRAYRTMEDSVADYFDLLNYNRYKATLSKTSVKDCITAIKQGGYATSPTYINTIQSFYNLDRDLIESYRVDGVSTTPVTTTVSQKSNEDIALEVIAGKWGNGEDRKRRLTSAGYDYSSIQKLVNKLLR